MAAASDAPTDKATPSASARSHALLDDYHRHFDEASRQLRAGDPADPSDRRSMRERVRQCLGVHEHWVPQLSVRRVRSRRFEGFTVDWLVAGTWPGTTGTALLYTPAVEGDSAGLPLVLLCCGHGRGGKLTAGYQRMAQALARRGAMVLCPDNLGQGEREPMGHRDAVTPFACGTSVQGLIVMETLGWLGWGRAALPVDPQRMAAIGNSGGGLLTLMMIPFAPDLAAMASTGYPSTFAFIARKEKKHCHCNILPGIARVLEMHHIYGCFAPRPLLLLQGQGDKLFPPDLFELNARRVRQHYENQGAADRLVTQVMPGDHAWDAARIERITTFLESTLQLNPAPAGVDPPLLGEDETCLAAWPDAAVDISTLARRLTGRDPGNDLALWDVFPPAIDPDTELAEVLGRGEIRQVLAQFEAFLSSSSDRQPVKA